VSDTGVSDTGVSEPGLSEPGDERATLRIGTAPGDLGRLYPWLDTQAEARHLPKTALAGMHVALEEAVMNVAMHAFAPGEPGEITVQLNTSPDAAALVVEDSGHPFDPTAAPSPERPATMSDARPGGLGLILLRHYCREISYARIGDRNRLTLRFPLPRP
jgi:anti-sigma regulatory factor (Ser/Thr protein kinase)